MNTIIYGLVDPRDPTTVMYVGKSPNPGHRTMCHIWSARTQTDKHLPRLTWIRTLLSEGVKPIPILLEETTTDRWQEREQHHIAIWRVKNPSLTNVAKGGHDFAWSPSTEERKKVAQKVLNTLRERGTLSERSKRAARAPGGVGFSRWSPEQRSAAAQKSAATKKARGD